MQFLCPSPLRAPVTCPWVQRRNACMHVRDDENMTVIRSALSELHNIHVDAHFEVCLKVAVPGWPRVVTVCASLCVPWHTRTSGQHGDHWHACIHMHIRTDARCQIVSPHCCMMSNMICGQTRCDHALQTSACNRAANSLSNQPRGHCMGSSMQ